MNRCNDLLQRITHSALMNHIELMASMVKCKDLVDFKNALINARSMLHIEYIRIIKCIVFGISLLRYHDIIAFINYIISISDGIQLSQHQYTAVYKILVIRRRIFNYHLKRHESCGNIPDGASALVYDCITDACLYYLSKIQWNRIGFTWLFNLTNRYTSVIQSWSEITEPNSGDQPRVYSCDYSCDRIIHAFISDSMFYRTLGGSYTVSSDYYKSSLTFETTNTICIYMTIMSIHPDLALLCVVKYVHDAIAGCGLDKKLFTLMLSMVTSEYVSTLRNNQYVLVHVLRILKVANTTKRRNYGARGRNSKWQVQRRNKFAVYTYAIVEKLIRYGLSPYDAPTGDKSLMDIYVDSVQSSPKQLTDLLLTFR